MALLKRKKESYFAKAKGFLLSPEKSFKAEAKADLMEALKYELVVSIPYTILGSILGMFFLYWILSAVSPSSLFTIPSMPLLFVSSLVLTYIGTFFMILIWGMFNHLFAYLFGAKGGIDQTMKAMTYSWTPMFVIGWIPLVNVAAWIWSLVIFVKGLKVLHKVDTGKAITMVIIPAILMALWLFFTFAILIWIFSNISSIPLSA